VTGEGGDLAPGPPAPLAQPHHEALASQLDAVFADSGSWEHEGHERPLRDRLAQQGLWRPLLGGVTPGPRGRDLTGLAMLRAWLAPLSAPADALVGVQGLVLAALAAGQPDRTASLRASILDGRSLGAFALTEPEAGSDLGALTTTAEITADGYLLRGRKTFISCGTVASFALVLAKVVGAGPPQASGARPVFGLFAVPLPSPGIVVEPLALLAAHDIAALTFDGVRLPRTAALDDRGRGLGIVLGALSAMRPTVGAAALGLARRALLETRSFLRARIAFGKPLADNDALRARLADHLVDWEAARLLVYRATWLLDQPLTSGDDAEKGGDARQARAQAGAMAKLHATETAQRIVDDALQMHGARGLVEGQVLARLYREVRALRIYEGTSEIQRALVARAFLEGQRA